MNPKRISIPIRLLGLGIFAFAAMGYAAPGRDPNRVHDPSTIVRCSGKYWLFATGQGVASRHSRDLENWENGPAVFAQAPEWTTKFVPENRGYFWAPDVIYHNNRYWLYYSVSAWGKNTSVIGLATNPTLDPADPNFHWKDEGPVFASGRQDEFNAIDPSVFKDENGTLWLCFGSFWSGIKLVQLDSATGHRRTGDSKIYSLARHNSIEAPCVYRHGPYYYLFVNWGICCRGTNSTYEIRVGRSSRGTGPYVDHAGRDMAEGGGTLLVGVEGNFIGPGHSGIFSENGTNWFSYHYYDRAQQGRPRLGLRRLLWSTNDWPSLQQR